jgi:hypothetical protein
MDGRMLEKRRVLKSRVIAVVLEFIWGLIPG